MSPPFPSHVFSRGTETPAILQRNRQLLLQFFLPIIFRQEQPSETRTAGRQSLTIRPVPLDPEDHALDASHRHAIASGHELQKFPLLLLTHRVYNFPERMDEGMLCVEAAIIAGDALESVSVDVGASLDDVL